MIIITAVSLADGVIRLACFHKTSQVALFYSKCTYRELTG